MTLLVVTAVEAERDAVVRDLGRCEPIEVGGFAGLSVDTPAGRLHVLSGGVGPVAAAIATAHALVCAPPYDLVASVGIAGGFRGRVAIGTVVVADYTTFADLGVRSDTGFLSPREMGLGQATTHPIAGEEIEQRLRRGPAPVTHGEILTLACMTGTEADADELATRYPRALAEAMEGFGVVDAAMKQANRPPYVTEIRAVSNLIGRRDRSGWDLPRAFDALSNACAALVKEPLP